MGQVALRFRVMPEKPENIDRIEALVKQLGPKEIKQRPIAFGLKFLDVLFVVSDAEGSDIEDKLKAVEGVASVESEGVTLI